ncbi:TSUP family transporter [Mesorhizobium sp. L-8-3]|uniref:TSUP family transporter n=1 Tax=Mesorhizobium sp. L-8-3 TaxID=2744522 RepID=UPI0019265C2F|nr:TSUP family transporter [Mesorhizobium sp. L-8-3]BCH25144.1 membrane protein [Mesorhizobium sp. L-8-3]
MDAGGLAILLCLAAVAAYTQTLTGFALGLILMGGVGLTGVIALPDAAVLVSCLTFVNAVLVLAKGWRDVALRQFVPIIVSSLAMLFAGYALLGVMAAASIDWLKLVLGGVIVTSSLQLAMKPTQLARLSSTASFLFFGAIAGLMGGLFSTSGPPLVYHLYRQPLHPVVIRETLVAVFAVNAVVRLGVVASVGAMPSAGFWWTLLTIPVVIVTTITARRWPPPLSSLTMRRLAFVLLFLSGASLALPAAYDIFL